MQYRNAADVLPKELLAEVLRYAKGELLYIPSIGEKKSWGEESGSRQFYKKRNEEIKNQYASGVSMRQLALEFHLSVDSIKKIVRQ